MTPEKDNISGQQYEDDGIVTSNHSYCDSDYQPPRGKLNCYNWLADVPGGKADFDLVEVQFKNTRKGFFRNSLRLPLEIGDSVVVEASPGYDIGQVTLIGELVKRQIRKSGMKPDAEIRRVLRKSKPADLDRFEEAKARENDTMIRARKIAEDLNLNMKIGDVEYQGDGNKAIFYYIADERVDFRQLIKVLADAFKVRIEMKQIGARQEAGRIGGIGPCGRPLCCASWMTNFVSVGTAAARFQDISLNPQKLAGQCAKLKCCLNFEVDAYVEAVKRLPGKEVRLETADATYFHFKSDVFNRMITYSTDKSIPANLVTIHADRAFEIIAMNKEGEKPLSLLPDGDEASSQRKPYADLLDQENISRFDSKRKKKKRKSKKEPRQTEGEGVQSTESSAESVEDVGGERNSRRGNDERRRGRHNRGRDRGHNRHQKPNDGDRTESVSRSDEQ